MADRPAVEAPTPALPAPAPAVQTAAPTPVLPGTRTVPTSGLAPILPPGLADEPRVNVREAMGEGTDFQIEQAEEQEVAEEGAPVTGAAAQ